MARRRDRVEVISAVLAAKVSVEGYRRIAERTGVPAGTVRGWLRRFASLAEAMRAHFTAWAYRLDALQGPIGPADSVLADALEAIGVAAGAARCDSVVARRGGWLAAMSGGWLLTTRVDLWPAP